MTFGDWLLAGILLVVVYCFVKTELHIKVTDKDTGRVSEAWFGRNED